MKLAEAAREMTEIVGNFEEIQLNDNRFTATTPSVREISDIYTKEEFLDD